jgi:hypothetical protein
MEPMPLKRRRPGRPKVGEGGRTGEFVGFRCPSGLKEQIEKAAAAAGRSISTECQFRIAQSFVAGETLAEATQLAQRLAYGKGGGGLLNLIGRLMRHGPAVADLDIEDEDHDWTRDPLAYRIAETEITHMLALLRPEGDPLSKPEREAAEDRVEKLLVGRKMIEPPAKWDREDAP